MFFFVLFPTVHWYCAVCILAWYRMISHYVWCAVQFASDTGLSWEGAHVPTKGTCGQYLAQPLSKVASRNVIITLVTYKLHTSLLSHPVKTPKGTGTVPYP